MANHKKNASAILETAVTQPLTSEENRLAEVQTKDKTLGAFGEVSELCKTEQINAALKVIENITSVRVSDNPDECLNLAVQQMMALEPQSYLEATLIAQMLQVNAAIVKCMGLAFMKDQTPHGKELNANLATKLQRTFVAQVDALQKLRGTGGQKVTVKHVHVHEGGQAIVGNVNHTTGGEGGKDGK